MTAPDRQRGVALLIVLLLLVSVAGVAVATTALMTRTVATATAAQGRDQAVWALLGAERAALLLADADEGLGRGPVSLTTDTGRLTVALVPKACLNINAIVTGTPGAYATPTGQAGDLAGPGAARFGALVTALGGYAPKALLLLEGAADFIDADDVPNTGGEEDFGYARRTVPYRTAGALVADVSELRAVAGWDVATYRALSPYLCALPTTNAAKIDVNGLRPGDAPLLAAVLDNQLAVRQIERVIEERPRQGWDEASTFLALPSIAALNPAPPGLSELDVNPTVLNLTATAEGSGYSLTMTALLFKDPARGWRVISRRFGA